MKTEYILRINVEQDIYSKLSELFEVIPTESTACWEFSIDERSLLYPRAIMYFLDLIENNKDNLNEIGIQGNQMSIWYLYEYEDQCNMEFTPDELRRLGENGIVLCISCWKKDDYMEI